MRNKLYRISSLVVVMSLILEWLAWPVAIPAASVTAVSDHAPPARLYSRYEQPAPARPDSSSYWADANGDQRVDSADLQIVAGLWNCATGQPCYDPTYDRDGDGDIDALDLAALGNEYDVSPPDVVITTPAANAVVGGTTLLVAGTVSDAHAITAVTVNGVPATVAAGAFQATIPLAPGNQSIHVTAVDEIGQSQAVSQLVFADQEGPFVTVHAPPNRQSVYTLRPTIAISYTDFYTGVNPATLQVTLTEAGGPTTNVTGDLTIGPGGASGQVSFDLSQDAVYTLTASLQDSLGNSGALATTFYVPLNPAAITPPAEPDNAGWVSGVVYDSTTCDQYLVACQGIAGVTVTLAVLSETVLLEARQARALELARHEPGRAPLSEPEVAITTAVSGAIVTGPDGFFAFPVAGTDRYALRVEKEGYTYSQRVAEIVRGHSAPVNEIYVTPVDAALTLCGSAGCSHTSADGQLQVVIPPGAIPPGDQIEVTATEFDRVVFLPSGELPPGTWETYAFNLGGDSDYQFLQPVTVRVANSRGFAAGEIVPLGYWNADLLQWEHAGTSTIDPTGQWVEMEVMHFSNYDPNCALPAGADSTVVDETEDGEGSEDPCCSSVTMRGGHLRQQITLPAVQILGQTVAPAFNYASDRAAPSGLIEAQLDLDVTPGVVVSDFVQIELFIEGEKTANFSFAAEDLNEGGELGRFRYLWDGRDAQGRRLPPGAYRYALHVRVPYRAEYYRTINNLFGFVIDYSQPMNVFADATESTWLFGSVKLTGDPAAPFGAGWSLAGVQHLYEDEAGRILIDDGQYNTTEYYFPYKSLLPTGGNLVPAADSDLFGLYGPPGQAALPAGPPALPPGSLVASPAAPPATLRRPAADPLGPVVFTTLLTTTVSGPIVTDTTWSLAGSPYVMTADVTVNPGVVLTVEPGVVVMGQLNAELTVQGYLQAIGTPAQPITFTSTADTGPGQWQGIYFNGGSGHLNHTTVRYGGAGAAISFYANITAINVPAGQELRVENSRILSAAGPAPSAPDYGLSAANSAVVVANTLFAGNGDGSNDAALNVTGSSSRLTLTGSAFENNAGRPIRLPAETLHLLGPGNSFSGNELNRVFVTGGSLAGDATFSTQAGLQAYQLETDVRVTTGRTLVVEPGVMVMGQLNAELTINGHLQALGAPAQPITFTSDADSGPSQWQGLLFNGGTGHLDNVTVRNSGLGSGGGAGFAANVTVVNTPAGGAVRIENSRILSVAGSAPSTTDYGLYVSIGAVVVSNTLFFGNGNDTNDFAFYSTGAGTVLTVVNNIFQANAGQPLRAPAASLPAVRQNSFSENGVSVIAFYGNWTAGENVSLDPQTGITDFLFENSVTIAPTVIFTVPAGINLRWNSQGMTVNGRLEAIGQAGAPILFTSDTDFQPGEWSGIFVGASGEVELEWVIIRHAGTGLNIQNGKGRLQNGAVVDNSAWGINLGGNTTDFSASLSDISGNGQFGLRNVTDVLVDARFNWWGHPSGPFHPTLNPGGLGNQVGDDVLFVPWLEQPVSDLGITNLTATDYTLLVYDLDSDTYTRHYQDGTMVHFNPDGTHDYTLDTVGNRLGYTYDTFGRIATMYFTLSGEVTPDWVWTFTYQAAALGQSRSPLGPQSTIQVVDPAGRLTTLTLDGHGHLSAVQQPGLTAPMAFAYDPDGRMTHKTEERGFTTTYAYDANGRIDHAVLPPRPVFDPLTGLYTTRSQVRDFTPSDSAYQLANNLAPGTPVSPTAALVQSSQLFSVLQADNVFYRGLTSAFGSPLSATDALSRTVQYERDDRDRVTRAIRPDGSCVEYTYDEDGNVFSELGMGPTECAQAPLARDPASVQGLTRTYEPRFNQLRSVTDALGRTTLYRYDYELVGQGERGLLVQIDFPAVPDENGVVVTPTVTYEYDGFGQVTREVNVRGVATCYAYTDGSAGEAADGAAPRFAPGVLPVPGHLTQVRQDCDGPQQVTTAYTNFDAAGNPQTIVLPTTPAGPRQVLVSYDDRNRILSETNPLGVATSVTYDNGDNLVQMVEDVGGINRVLTFTFDPANQLVEARISGGGGETIGVRYGYDLNGNRTLVQDGRGNRTRYFYDDAQQLVRIENALGQATTYSYADTGQELSQTDPRGVVSQGVYDGLGRETQFVYDVGGLNLTTSSVYDAANREISQTTARGVQHCYTYDNLDRLVTAIKDCGGLNATTTFTYDLNGNIVRVTDPEGRESYFTYDRLDRLTAITDALGLTDSYIYDPVGNPLTTVDRLGRVTSYAYDALDRLTVMTDALGGTVTSSYDALNRLTAVTDKLGQTSQYAYDVFDRRTQVVDPAGGVSRDAYDANSNPTAMIDPLGRVTRFNYDALDRPVAGIEPDGSLSSYVFDPVGNLTATTDALNRTTNYAYDGANRLVAATDPLGHVTAYAHDADGNRLSIADPLGQTRRFAYDALNRTTVITDANGAATFAAYDLLGNRLSLTDPNGNATTSTYDALNRLLSETNALGATRTYEYDAEDNIVALTDRNGRRREFTYDALDQILAESWIGDGRVIAWTYDAMSQQITVQDADSAYSMSYDALGRNTSVSNAGTPGVPSVVLSYGYDTFSNVRTVAEVINGQAGGVADYTYDLRNRVIRITQSGSGVAPKRVDVAYDAVSQLTGLQRYRDLAGAQLVAGSAMDYDAADRLTSLTHTPAAAPPRVFTWQYDAARRPTGATLPDGASDFTYDARHQLLSADHTFQPDEAYTYDPAGNRTGGGYAVGPANRLLSDGVYNYAYDAEGNRTQRTEIATGAITEYDWDYRNRLASVLFQDAGMNVTAAITHTYDVFDRRIAATVDPDGGGPAGTSVERFVYDGMNIALAFDGAGNLTHRYFHGPMVDMVLADEHGSGQVYWPLTDRLGSVVDLLDNDGALQNHRVYDAFGRITAETDPALDHRFAFTGREWDQASGLYYYRARYYDPQTGQFISEDPVGFLSGDTNLYRYVGNYPTGYRDPSGHGWLEIGRAFDRALAKVDSFVAGFADSVSVGLTTKARGAAYGHTATKNHQGAAFTAGQVVGAATSIATGGGGMLQAANAAKLAKAGKGLADAGKAALAQAGRYQNQARMAGQMGLPQRTLQLLQRATGRRDISERLLQDAFGKAVKAMTLQRSARAAGLLGTAEFGMGSAALALKALGLDPCDPLDWWDALYLLPLFQQARNLRNRFRPRTPELSPNEKIARDMGFKDYDELTAWEARQVIHEAGMKLRAADKRYLPEWIEGIAKARSEGVEDTGRAVIRLTDEGVDEMMRIINRAMRDNPGELTLDGNVRDTMRKLITGDAAGTGASKYGSVGGLEISRGPYRPGVDTPSFWQGPAPPPGSGAGTLLPLGDANDAPTVFFSPGG